MLTSMLPFYSCFTANKKYPGPSSSSSNIKKSKKNKLQGRDYLVYDEERDMHVQSGALKQKKAADEKRARQEAALLREERAKKAKFDNLTTLTGLNKEQFRTMRAQNFYDMPNNSTDGYFWRKEQELIMKEIYAIWTQKLLCVLKNR